MNKDILKNWIILNAELKYLTLEEVKRLLKREQTDKNRKTFIARIKQRIVGAEMEKINARYPD